MPQTIEALIGEKGNIQLLESITLSTTHRALVTILEETAPLQKKRPFGLAAGEFIVPDDFDQPLPENILRAFEGL